MDTADGRLVTRVVKAQNAGDVPRLVRHVTTAREKMGLKDGDDGTSMVVIRAMGRLRREATDALDEFAAVRDLEALKFSHEKQRTQQSHLA